MGRVAKEIKVALAGNPNVGKSVIFNNLTRGRQHVGNWPGKTVEKKEGHFYYRGVKVHVVDLPGTYSLTAYSPEELIARNYIIEEEPDVVVDVVDASNLERNLYLTLQLLELGANLIIALNKVDLASSLECEVDAKGLEEALGVPVVATVAPRGIGMEELKAKIVEMSGGGSKAGRLAPCGAGCGYCLLRVRRGGGGPRRLRYSEEVEEAISRVEAEVLKDPALSRYNARWLAIKLLEGDEEVRAKVSSSPRAGEVLEAASRERERLSKRFGMDAEIVLANERYRLVEEIVRRVLKGSKSTTPSDLIDKVVLDRYLGIPIFLVALWAMFQFTMAVSAPFCDILGDVFALLSSFLKGLTGNPALDDLLFGDYGVLNGLGTILSFVPIIFFLYFALSLLEDSGYMARVAFVTDRAMRKVGLSGRAVISMIIGFGCNVPAVYSTRAIPDEGDRLIATVVNPLMLCSARLTVFSMLAYAFFRRAAGSAILSLYLLGLLLAVAVAMLLRRAYLRGRSSPLILELPLYQRPTLRSVALHMWERALMFVKKAGTVILAGLLFMDVLMHLSWPGLTWVEDVGPSAVAAIGRALQPLFSPLGWDWRLAVSVIFGFVAKEVVLGSMSLLYGAPEAELGDRLSSLYTPLQAYSFMAFVLIYVPCVVTVAAIAHERGWRWALFTVVYEVLLAYAVALAIYLVGSALGLG